MATQSEAMVVPPVEALVSEVIGMLAYAAHGYLRDGDSPPDLTSADIAIDLAGKAFERIEPRLGSEERAAVAAVLTDLRMTFVRKRGL
jgi:hypothetical protein